LYSCDDCQRRQAGYGERPARPPDDRRHALLDQGGRGGCSGQHAFDDCDLDGNSTFSFHASGEAQGPYPGKFKESGTVVIGPQTQTTGQESGGAHFPDAPWVSINADFTITSGSTSITGTKTLADSTYNYPYNEAVCATFPNSTAAHEVTSGYAYGGTSDKLHYEITITGSSKKPCRDSGDSYLTFADANYELSPDGPQVIKSFFESFTSSLGDSQVGCETGE
jgi:hypothetical protein